MGIFSTLTEKSWINSEQTSNQIKVSQIHTIWPAKTALKFFLAVVSVFFMLFTITFLSRSQSIDFQALSGEPWLPLSDASQLWWNSLILLFASICMHFAVQSCKKQQWNIFILSLSSSCLMTMAFIFSQVYVWQLLTQKGFFIYSNPANSFFYLLTGIHLLHLAGGMFALTRVYVIYWRHGHTLALLANLRLCAIYWHYLFIIWLYLFFLLTADSTTYKTIALFCGF